MAGQSAYLQQLQGYLPPGQAWTRARSADLTKVLNIIAAELARVDARVQDLFDEADPRTTDEMLTDWEHEYGLPDACTPTAITRQERIDALVEKYRRIGGQSPPYFIALAARLGYQIEIEEYRPFICGWSECGEALNGPDEVRYQWTVRVLGARLIDFYCGVSECGDALGDFRRAEDLECLLRLLQPAHTHLIVTYEGV